MWGSIGSTQPLILYSGQHYLTSSLPSVPVLFSIEDGRSHRFTPPWTVEWSHEETFAVKDANGIVLATVHCRADLQKWSFGHSKLSSKEARKIAKAIARIPGS
jgi:hypothetical protein